MTVLINYVVCFKRIKSHTSVLLWPDIALQQALQEEKKHSPGVSLQNAVFKSAPKWTLHPHLFTVKPLAWQKYLALPLSWYWICHPPLPVLWTNVKVILPVVIFCTMSSTIPFLEMMLSMRRISKRGSLRLPFLELHCLRDANRQATVTDYCENISFALRTYSQLTCACSTVQTLKNDRQLTQSCPTSPSNYIWLPHIIVAT